MNYTTILRNEGTVELAKLSEGYVFSLRLRPPQDHPASGIESPPRKVSVSLKVIISAGTHYIQEHLLRPTDEVCGELLTKSWGERTGNGAFKDMAFDAFTLSSAVDAAVAYANEIDAAAYAHQVARAAAIAAENAAYAIRLAS